MASSAEVAITMVVREIALFGGEVVLEKPNWCSLSAGFLVPAGPSLEFLLALRVSLQLAHSHNMAGEQLEIIYHGTKSMPIQLASGCQSKSPNEFDCHDVRALP